MQNDLFCIALKTTTLIRRFGSRTFIERMREGASWQMMNFC